MTTAEIVQALERLDTDLRAGLEARPGEHLPPETRAELLTSPTYRAGYLKSSVKCAREAITTLIERVRREAAIPTHVNDGEAVHRG